VQKSCIWKACTTLLSVIRFHKTDNQNRHFNVSEWAEDSAPCGHCDNCTRDPTSIIQSDVTLDAKRVLAVARTLYSRKIKVTAAQLAQAARGTGEKAKALHLSPADQVTLSLLVRPVSHSRPAEVSS
jgi:ATP-dependent DNA helicase Q1